MKNDKFVPLKETYKKKMSNWLEKYLSGPAKEVQIKAVMQAITTYTLNVFKFSVGLCDELMQLIRQFWWGDEHDRRNIHWTSWENLTKSKYQGGMGFKDLKLFNQALLARQAWRLIAFPNSLCARLMKAKYYPKGELTDTTFIQNPSPCWQGITHGLELLKKLIVWKIGNGEKVRIWRDNWIPRGEFKITKNLSKSRLRKVKDIIDQDNTEWKEDVVKEIFMAHDAEEVLKIRLPQSDSEDFISWQFEKSGQFSVRSASKLALNEKMGIKASNSSSTNGDRSLWKTFGRRMYHRR
jgi:hypothetical protein